MELNEFVAETLKQIVEGAELAQKTVKEKGATVNPNMYAVGNGISYQISNPEKNTVQMIEFDVSLTEMVGKEAGGHIGVLFGSFGIGAKGKTETENNSMNRVKFSVPLSLPLPNPDEPKRGPKYQSSISKRR